VTSFMTRPGLTAESEAGRSGTVPVMASHASDGDCLARSLTEPRAFEALFGRHFDAIYGYLHRRVGPDLADELAAETFTLAFERRSTCRARGSVLPWLYGIATNLASRRWRGERRRLRAYGRSGVDRWVAYDDEVVARVDGSAFRARLECALAEMRPRERDALQATSRTRISRSTYAEPWSNSWSSAGGWLRSTSPRRQRRSTSYCELHKHGWPRG
jgi:RNA polymerase sigma-70 factor, ECF subfamily